jgi:putative acid phosphatase of HAD superfamily subfamily IIIB
MFSISTRAAVAVATLGLVAGGSGAAIAGTSGSPRHGGYEGGGAPTDIPNLGLVKNQIKSYYGDDGTTDSNATSTSAYAHDVRGVEAKAAAALPRLVRGADERPVVVVDVDDTTLLTYRYEATHDFGYDPAVNAAYIHDTGMPAVFGMPRLLRTAVRDGATVYYLTGRPETQRADTERDLRRAGYPGVRTSHVFLRDKANPPAYLAHCDRPTATPATSCTTVQYKSSTRRHIERLKGGQEIVLNMGDQFSDLAGGHAEKRLKLPNPMYFLP